MPSYTAILKRASALHDHPEAMAQTLWCSERVFTDALAARLDELAPKWRERMGSLMPLLWMARAGAVEPWIDLATLPLDDLTLPQRQRLIRALKHTEHHPRLAALLSPAVFARCIEALYAQWLSADAPKQGRWVQPLTVMYGSAAHLERLYQSLWRAPYEHWRPSELLHQLLSRQDQRAHRSAQLIAYHHPLPALREAAQEHNQRWADQAKLSPMAWADAITGRWEPTEPEERARLKQLTIRRLDLAIRQQHAWSLSELREVICAEHPLAMTLRALIWVNERDQWCSLDERAQPRDVHDEAISARSLTLAHPLFAPPAPALKRWRERRLDTPPLIEQLERAVFTAATLTAHEDTWSRPSWPERLRPSMIMRSLRGKQGWTLTKPEDSGAIAGLYLYDERHDQTALVRFMDRLGQPRYGHLFHQEYLYTADEPISWGIILLKGRWDKQRLDWSFSWPPNFPSYGISRTDIAPLEDADALFLSEVLRDLHRASR